MSSKTYRICTLPGDGIGPEIMVEAKKVLAAVEQKDADLAASKFNEAQGVIDKAVVKGVVHRNTAARRKSMMAAKVKSLTPQA